ncbi:uncharacterized protein LOC144055426 isoform X2 [Vanacampus margaritifer]
MCGVNWFPKGTLLRSWLTKSRPRLLLLIAGLKRPQVTLMRRKRMKRTKVAKATFAQEIMVCFSWLGGRSPNVNF